MESEKSKRKNEASRIKRDVWFYLLILILITIAVILILAMLSPAIGNIFSNIPCACSLVPPRL